MYMKFVPNVMRFDFDYWQPATLLTIASPAPSTYQSWTLNNIYDPNPALGGRTSSLETWWQYVYKTYLVLRATVEIDITNVGNDGCYAAFMVDPSLTNTAPTALSLMNIYDWKAIPTSQRSSIHYLYPKGVDGSHATIKKTFDLPSLYQMTQTESVYSGNFGENPGQYINGGLFVFNEHQYAGAGDIGVIYTMRIRYHTRMQRTNASSIAAMALFGLDASGSAADHLDDTVDRFEDMRVVSATPAPAPPTSRTPVIPRVAARR